MGRRAGPGVALHVADRRPRRDSPSLHARRAADYSEDDASEVALLKHRHLIRTRAGQGRDLLEPYHDRIGILAVDELSPEELRGCHHREGETTDK